MCYLLQVGEQSRVWVSSFDGEEQPWKLTGFGLQALLVRVWPVGQWQGDQPLHSPGKASMPVKKKPNKKRECFIVVLSTKRWASPATQIVLTLLSTNTARKNSSQRLAMSIVLIIFIKCMIAFLLLAEVLEHGRPRETSKGKDTLKGSFHPQQCLTRSRLCEVLWLSLHYPMKGDGIGTQKPQPPLK